MLTLDLTGQPTEGEKGEEGEKGQEREEGKGKEGMNGDFVPFLVSLMLYSCSIPPRRAQLRPIPNMTSLRAQVRTAIV